MVADHGMRRRCSDAMLLCSHPSPCTLSAPTQSAPLLTPARVLLLGFGGGSRVRGGDGRRQSIERCGLDHSHTTNFIFLSPSVVQSCTSTHASPLTILHLPLPSHREDDSRYYTYRPTISEAAAAARVPHRQASRRQGYTLYCTQEHDTWLLIQCLYYLFCHRSANPPLPPRTRCRCRKTDTAPGWLGADPAPPGGRACPGAARPSFAA